MLHHIIHLVTAAAILSVAFITGVVLLFWRRTRLPGIRVLAITVLAGAAWSWLVIVPRSYERSYLNQPDEPADGSLRERADAARFYLGAVGDLTTIAHPRFQETFNSTTVENALKMGDLFAAGQIGVYDFSRADAMVDLALNKGLRVRGHTLIWGKESDLFKAPDLEAYLRDFPVAERSRVLRLLVEKHIRTVLGHYRGRIRDWDVVNEPLYMFWSEKIDENVFFRHLGRGYIADAFRLARSADPDARLYLNEQLESFSDERAEAFFALAKELKESGAPVDGIGLQSHFGFELPSLPEFRTFLRRLTALGFEVEVTELDARLRLFGGAPDPYRAQGRFYAEMLSICLETPGCRGLTFWGFADNACWMDALPLFAKPNEPYLFDRDMNPKPAVNELYRVFEQHPGPVR